MAAHPDTKVDCSKVYIKRSSFATEDNEFDGAFAFVPIKKGAFETLPEFMQNLRTPLINGTGCSYFRIFFPNLR
jgi:hypothetical protein